MPLYAGQFGVGNQVEQFALIERLRDPLFARGDFYVNSATVLGQPRYYYALAMSWIAGATSLATAVHTAAFLSNFLLGVTSFVAARRFFAATATGAAAAAAMAVLNGSFSLGLAGYLSFDSYQPASFAIAVVLSGVTLLLLGRGFAASVCFILGGLAHPTIGVEIALIAFAATGMTDVAKARSFRAVLPLVIPGLLFLSAMVVAWALPNMHANAYRMSAATFFDIIAFRRAPHHYLGLKFPGMAWFHAALFVMGTSAVYGYALRRLGPTRERIALAVMAVLVIALCLASLWLVDVAHNRFWVTAQVFRMLLLVKWVGFLLLGWLIGGWLIRLRPTYLMLAGTLVAVNADAEPRALILVLLAALAIEVFRPVKVLSAGVVLVTLGLSLYFQHKYGIDKQALRLGAACVVIALIYMAPLPARLSLAAAAAFSLAFLAFGYVTRADGFLGKEDLAATYDWQDHRDDAADIARKAAATSPPGSIWLTPPDMESFRLISRRAVLVDFKSIPFEDRAMLEWQRRIETLYGPLTGTGFGGRHQMEDNHRDRPALARARSLGANFAVLDVKTDWHGPVLARNASFKAIRIP
ncbi:MAG: hypothetical protein IPG62_14490 [Sphingomonadales bacterium]|nr:hypothetical protein [Sphingomonadales bacterium]